MTNFKLHHEPHRHYKLQKPDGKWSWQNRDKVRIASVTDVLDKDSALTNWAVGNALVAAERVAVQWLDAGPALAGSVLDFALMANLTGLMPNDIRDDKGVIGTAAHHYLGEALQNFPGGSKAAYIDSALPFGYKTAIDIFLADTGFIAAADENGERVERAVGSEELAVAGTYDAQGAHNSMEHPIEDGVHRIDLKSSNSVQPKHFAQLAAYEHLAIESGEEPSEWLTIIHINALGDWRPYSIKASSTESERAFLLFMSYLNIRRSEAALAKLLKPPTEED